MARFTFQGLDDLVLSMEEVARIPESVIDGMLEAGADTLIPEIKARGEGYGVRDSGTMLDSLARGKIRQDRQGTRTIWVYFKGSRVQGTDKKTGKPRRVKNGEIAFLNEFGTRHQMARPFVGDTVEMSKATVTNAQAAVYDAWLQEIGLL